MKKIFLFVITLTLVIMIGVSIFNKDKESYDEDIVNFEYSFGGYPDGYWDYQIYMKNGKTYILAKGINGVDLNIDKEVDNSVLIDIAKIVKEYEIYNWNGFNKKSNIVDGYTFSLTIKYSDGVQITAYGHEKYPDNYKNIHEVLLKYIESIK